MTQQTVQPYDVNGMKLGIAFSDWSKGGGSVCSKSQRVEPNVDSYSCPDLTYAGLRMQEMANFYQGRLMSIYLLLSHKDFRALDVTLKQRFGQPMRAEQTAFPVDGTTISGLRERWSNGVSSINLVEFGPDRDHAVLFFAHVRIMAEKAKSEHPGGM